MRKRAIWGTVLAALLVVAWMLWPRSLAKAFDAEQQFAATVVKTGVKDGESWSDSSEQYDLEGSAALREVLEDYSYHLCWDTLRSANSMDLKGGTDETVYLFNARAEGLMTGGTSRVLLNGRIYRIGYLGNRRGTALSQELLAALRAE